MLRHPRRNRRFRLPVFPGELALGTAFFMLCLMPASAQQAPAPDSDGPLDHLSALSSLNSHATKDFHGNSMFAAQQLADSEFKELPSFVSEQTVRRALKKAGEDVAGIDQVKLEVTLEPSGKIVNEVPNIEEYSNDDDKYCLQGGSVDDKDCSVATEEQLNKVYKDSPGLQITGIYAGSIATPFEGGLPTPLKVADPKVVKAGPAGALVYTFNSNGKKPMSIGLPAAEGQDAQPDEKIDVKGYAYFDHKGQLLKMIMNGYGMVRIAHYVHEEITFAPTQIDGLGDKVYYLPQASEIEMGESEANCNINYTTYDKYRKYSGSGTAGAGVLDDDDSTPKKPQ